MLMKQQDKPKALDGLDWHGSAADGGERLLQELLGESTKSGTWSWHSGILFSLGFLGVHLLLPEVRRNHDVICGTDHLATSFFRSGT
jgi:hypothetical protein